MGPTTYMTAAELLAHAEALRLIQRDLNRNDGLALSTSAWGDLHNAIVKIVAEMFVAEGEEGTDAMGFAKRVVDETYYNGENIAWQLKLLKEGVIS